MLKKTIKYKKIMNKKNTVEVIAKVVELLPGGKFKLIIEDKNDCKVIAYSGGKMRKNKIRILPGDKVTVEINSYDITQGRIIHRHK